MLVSRVPDIPLEPVQPPATPRDFPWIPGAQPNRVAEETTVGVGARMYGRLFAKVEFGASIAAATAASVGDESTRSKQATLVGARANRNEAQPIAQIACTGVTCLDAARELMLQDAQRKAWRVILNRRVGMHQSFLFQRGERAAWVEITSSGPNTLAVDYALVPVQDVQDAQAPR